LKKPLCELLEVPISLDLTKYLEEMADKYKLRYLLAHAEDGVIWGEFRDGKLVTADSAFDFLPKFRCFTLQQCRAFGETSEVMLWRSNDGFKARVIQDEGMKECEYIPENQILWGTKTDKEPNNGFTLVSDGSQGLRHAVPLTGIEFNSNPNKLYRPLRLMVRHYIDEEETGLACIYLSRLVNLTTIKELANVAKTSK
jgi:CRISPR-associated protein (TIGR03984 family)